MPVTLIVQIVLWLLAFIVIASSAGSSDPAGNAMAAGFLFALVFLPVAIYSLIATLYLCCRKNLARHYRIFSIACSLLIIPAFLMLEGVF